MSHPPKMVKLASSGATVFLHPCSRCGAPDAPFGSGVNLRKGILGTWLCSPCRRAPKAPSVPKAPPVLPKAPAIPGQGSLF